MSKEKLEALRHESSLLDMKTTRVSDKWGNLYEVSPVPHEVFLKKAEDGRMDIHFIFKTKQIVRAEPEKKESPF